MITSIQNHAYILATILFTVYGHVILKWQVSLVESPPADIPGKLIFLFRLLLNPWVISSIASAFFAALSWMMAMSRFDLSYAYPFMSAAFALVLVCSYFFLDEPLGLSKIIGVSLIMTGIFIVGQGETAR